MLVTKPNTQIESTLVGDRIAMQFDPAATIHLMGIMTDLYSDPTTAVIREYTTNAHDAHIDAGYIGPIHVTLPTPLLPVFKVQDFGKGLDADDIAEIYSLYGASTKRGGNEQQGMLGLGCKSALAYGPQFTLSSVKNGVRTRVSITRDESGAGSMTIVDQVPSIDHSGTEIIVPLSEKGKNDFESKANEFFRYWKPGTVLVNGKEPEPFDGIWLSDHVLVIKDDYARRGKHEIVMGNVPYPATINTDGVLAWGCRVIAYVGIGEVDPVPSREELRDTKQTKETIARIEYNLVSLVRRWTQKAINEAKTPAMALKVQARLKETAGGRMPLPTDWKGVSFPTAIETNEAVVTGTDSYKLSSHDRNNKLYPHVLVDAHFFTGYNAKNFTAGQKKKLLKWAEQNRIRTSRFVLLKDKTFNSKWVESERVHEWADVFAIKLPRNAPLYPTGRIPGSYDIYRNGAYLKGIPAADWSDTATIFWAPADRGQRIRAGQQVLHSYPENIVVALPPNRVAKFKRDFPKARNFFDVLGKQHERWMEKNLNGTYGLALAMRDSGYNRTIGWMDWKRVYDPDLVKLIKAATQDLQKIAETDKLYSKAGLTRNGNVTEDHMKFIKDIKTKYLLFDSVYYPQGKAKEHLYVYANAAYAAAEKE